jgi:hypothetical protein
VTEQIEPDLSPEHAPGAATEEAMGELHGTVARVLTSHLSDPGEAGLSAAMVGAAITFLKNNNITASPSKNKDLAALKATLGSKRQRKELKPRDLQQAAEEFERMQGANGMPMQ